MQRVLHHLTIKLWHGGVGDRGCTGLAQVRVWPSLLLWTPARVLSTANTEILASQWRWLRGPCVFSPRWRMWLGVSSVTVPPHSHPALLLLRFFLGMWVPMCQLLCYLLDPCDTPMHLPCTSKPHRHLHWCVLSLVQPLLYCPFIQNPVTFSVRLPMIPRWEHPAPLKKEDNFDSPIFTSDLFV